MKFHIIFHLTGFGEFNGIKENPSSDVAKLVTIWLNTIKKSSRNTSLTYSIQYDILKVDINTVYSYFENESEKLLSSSLSSNDIKTLHIYIHIGVAAGRRDVTPELFGYNEADFRCKDENGNMPRSQPILGETKSLFNEYIIKKEKICTNKEYLSTIHDINISHMKNVSSQISEKKNNNKNLCLNMLNTILNTLPLSHHIGLSTTLPISYLISQNCSPQQISPFVNSIETIIKTWDSSYIQNISPLYKQNVDLLSLLTPKDENHISGHQQKLSQNQCKAFGIISPMQDPGGFICNFTYFISLYYSIFIWPNLLNNTQHSDISSHIQPNQINTTEHIQPNHTNTTENNYISSINIDNYIEEILPRHLFTSLFIHIPLHKDMPVQLTALRIFCMLNTIISKIDPKVLFLSIFLKQYAIPFLLPLFHKCSPIHLYNDNSNQHFTQLFRIFSQNNNNHENFLNDIYSYNEQNNDNVDDVDTRTDNDNDNPNSKLLQSLYGEVKKTTTNSIQTKNIYNIYEYIIQSCFPKDAHNDVKSLISNNERIFSLNIPLGTGTTQSQLLDNNQIHIDNKHTCNVSLTSDYCVRTRTHHVFKNKRDNKNNEKKTI